MQYESSLFFKKKATLLFSKFGRKWKLKIRAAFKKFEIYGDVRLTITHNF